MRDCHVRKLSIQAPDAPAARRAALLIEDGLRTASLPGESSRLVILRRLEIGRLPAGANPPAVALRIEQALAHTPLQAVAAQLPSAATAPAVYFADEVEPLVVLAVRLAQGQPAREWFWGQAVPGFHPALTARDGVRMALLAAAQSPLAATAVVRVVAGLAAAGALDAALGALQPDDGPALLHLCGWSAAASGKASAVRMGALTPAPALLTPAPALLTPLHAQRVRHWAGAWGADDARALWLAAVLAVVDRPTRLADPGLPSQAALVLRQLTAPVVAHMPAPAAADSPLPMSTQSNEATRSDEGSHAHEPQAALAAGPSTNDYSPGTEQAAQPQAAGAEPGADAPAAAEPEPALIWWRGLPLQPSAAAGLFFLLPVLARLGIRDWLDEHPGFGPALPLHVLAEIARRLGVSAEDAVWPVLGADVAASDPALAAAVAAWCDRVDTWAAALPDLSLAAIVLRPGLLYATRTHLDVFFVLDQVDLRIRRLGLDQDPGWLQWFQRVVAFYYEAGLPTGEVHT